MLPDTIDKLNTFEAVTAAQDKPALGTLLDEACVRANSRHNHPQPP
jgi:hypothetical protein